MKNLTEALLQLEQQLLEVSKNTLKEAGEYGVKQAQNTTLFHHGNDFEKQIDFQAHTSTQGEIESHAEYSQYLEYGNNAGGDTIYPKAANVLHFFANGQEVFTKHVKAHGPLPFMDQAADKTEEQLPNIWAQEFDKIIK